MNLKQAIAAIFDDYGEPAVSLDEARAILAERYRACSWQQDWLYRRLDAACDAILQECCNIPVEITDDEREESPFCSDAALREFKQIEALPAERKACYWRLYGLRERRENQCYDRQEAIEEAWASFGSHVLPDNRMLTPFTLHHPDVPIA
jgi:hypothetical protein